MTRYDRSAHAREPRAHRARILGPVVAAGLTVAAGLPAAAQTSAEPCEPGRPCQEAGGGVVTPGVPRRQPEEWPAKREIGGCRIQNNKIGQVLPPNAHGDALFRILYTLESCPENALRFRDLLLERTPAAPPAKWPAEKPGPRMLRKDLTLQATQVGNRGRNNPLPQGSFSFFELVTGTYEDAYGREVLEPGEFFFGHFQGASTDPKSSTSILSPVNAGSDNNLLFESVVWDPRKGMFNFYEIRADGQRAVWFYRGDSEDILADIRKLDRNYVPGELLWGDEITGGVRLRCSGCHMNGGPIMKELAFPHDSWWRTERTLPLGSMVIAPVLEPIFETLVDASVLATWVKAGVEKLVTNDAYWAARSRLSLQEQLRPLFCEQEVNLASDTEPFERPNYDGLESDGVVRAPIGFFVNPRLLEPSDDSMPAAGLRHVVIGYSLYTEALVRFDSWFLDVQAGGLRPTDLRDKDHAFETPVKAWSDMRLVDEMVRRGVIDDEFVADVLAVDMTRPMFSRRRCAQLRLVPTLTTQPTTFEGWRKAFTEWRGDFLDALERSSQAGARELHDNLTNRTDPGSGEAPPHRTAAWHRRRALDLVEKVQANAFDQAAVDGYVRLLAQRRIAVFQAQISQNPQGQIFEPDFRLIFPTMRLLSPDLQQEEAYGGVPGQFWLDPATGLVELAP